MTKWLASVQSFNEASLLEPCLPDILDMKNPKQGALGAMEVSEVSQIVNMIAGRCLTSATIGDLPMQAELLAAGIKSMAETHVDFVKIGIFADEQLLDCLKALSPTLQQLNKPVIAVLFADQLPRQKVIDDLSRYGFQGVMIDTAIKNGRSLLDIWSIQDISEFVTVMKSQNVLCGLAGALRIEDIIRLKPLQADYLGFRSALCEQHNRIATLSTDLAKQLKQTISNTNCLVA